MAQLRPTVEERVEKLELLVGSLESSVNLIVEMLKILYSGDEEACTDEEGGAEDGQ